MAQAPRRGDLLDRHGHFHSEDIFKNWSPAAIVALGIHRVGFTGALMPRSASTPNVEDVHAHETEHQHEMETENGNV
jgi:hypothetical protein